MDPISDMIIRIKNAQLNKEKFIEIPASKFKLEILKILKNIKLIDDYKEINNNHNKKIKISLIYHNKKPAIRVFKRISKPGLRIYCEHKNIPNPLQGYGNVIISTSKGLMTGKEARKKGLGGEVICEIY